MRATSGFLLVLTLLFAFPAFSLDQANRRNVLERTLMDSRVIARVAAVAHQDLPQGILGRIIDEDIGLLRGKRADGGYDYAHFERIPAGTIHEGFTVNDVAEGKYDRIQLRAMNVFRLTLDLPGRRLLVTRNPRVWVERIDLDYTSPSGEKKTHAIAVSEWMEAGTDKTFELPDIARDVIVTVYARAEGRPANFEMELVKAELVDNADSPWFGSVQNAKLLRSAVERNDISAVQSFAGTLVSRLDQAFQQESPTAPVSVAAIPAAPATPPSASPREPLRPAGATPNLEAPPTLEIYFDLQRIEDLLTGSEAERREGLNLLHQLVRKLRESRLK